MARLRQLLSLLVVLSTFSAVALAKKNPDRTQFGRDIRVEVGEETGELTCMNCSIYIRGKVDGDATAFHGSIVVESAAEVTGDATAFLGGTRVEPGASISGDATTFAGAVRTQGQARIGGDRTSFEGRQWVAVIILAPLAILAVIIALIIWLVQRSRRDVNMPVRQTSTGQAAADRTGGVYRA